jgi:hypothetical protein
LTNFSLWQVDKLESLADSESKIPDPEEAKKAAKEAAEKAGAAVNNFSSDAMKVRARAPSWRHLGICSRTPV